LALSQLIGGFQSRLNAQKQLLSELPKTEVMVRQIESCFDNILRHIIFDHCPTHYMCPFNETETSSAVDCLVYENVWETHSVVSGRGGHHQNELIISVLQETNYTISKGCKSNIK
jgi:hypothetical protein